MYYLLQDRPRLCETSPRIKLTYGCSGADISRIAHGVEDGPVSVDGHRHQTEDGDGAEDHQKRHGEKTEVKVAREAHAGKYREWNAEESDLEMQGSSIKAKKKLALF